MKNKFSVLAIVLTCFTFNACINNNFDEPPGFTPEVVEANGTVGDLLSLWKSGAYTEVVEDLIIDGRVVANDNSGNFYKQLVIQDETGGIQIRLDAIGLFNEFPEGRNIFVKCKGLFISDYNGLPQLSAVSGSGIDLTSIAIPEPLIPEFVFNSNDTKAVEPRVIKIKDNKQSYVNTLVKYEGVQFTVGSAAKPLADAVRQFSVNHDLEDCDEDLVLVRTSGFASFANEFTPTGKGSAIGILSVFRSDYQLLLRNHLELDMMGDRCDGGGGTTNNGDPVDSVDENFESLTNNQDANLTNWKNIAVKGTRLWRAKTFDNNVYVQATAYNDTSDEMEAWLITPKIKFDAPMKLVMRTSLAFYTHEGLSVWYSKDFNGSNVTGATWTELTVKLASQSTANYAWVNSGDIDLSAIIGEAYIGFRYIGNPASGTTTSIIDDVKIVDK